MQVTSDGERRSFDRLCRVKRQEARKKMTVKERCFETRKKRARFTLSKETYL